MDFVDIRSFLPQITQMNTDRLLGNENLSCLSV